MRRFRLAASLLSLLHHTLATFMRHFLTVTILSFSTLKLQRVAQTGPKEAGTYFSFTRSNS
ncbi:hypothetical protein PSP6_500036 [Paraburkholderia tropica]|nr:hypothetical protein PSP6_500036 [Paraburkholderia tropica]